MGKELTIIAVVGSIIFSAWYFSKQGCRGEGPLMGSEGSLCWSGKSLEEMLGGIGGGGEAPPDDAGSDLPPVDPSGSPAERERMRVADYKLRGTKDRDPVTGAPSPITPASRSSWAHAYFVNNRITVA